MIVRLGIDIAVRAAHQGSLADQRGELLWSGRRFRTTVGDLEQLWSMLPAGTTGEELTVVMEPTRNAWVALAAWFRRRGATVILVPPERSADLRAYYAKHTKSDRLDSVMLARLPLLHPDGLHPEYGLGPGDPLRRATKLHSSLVKRRTASLARLDALLEAMRRHGIPEQLLTDIQSGCAALGLPRRPASQDRCRPAPARRRCLTDRSARRLLAS